MGHGAAVIHHGDCLDVLRTLPDCSVDAVVTDPPYGLSFMGRKWDYDVPSVDIWAECLRVLKPGGHLLAFAGTRTQHRMAVRIEDAGFEIRDMIAWVYGSGFPKSLDVSKQIDKAAGVAVSGDGYIPNGKNNTHKNGWGGGKKTEAPSPATPAARQWQGWGTALKPALEPITVARKPLIGTTAENVLRHGTGGLNVDGCRVGDEDLSAQWDRSWNQDGSFGNGKRASQGKQVPSGRWPANLIHDGSEEPTNLLGDAARFFYCAKASKRDRDDGLEMMPDVSPAFGASSGDGLGRGISNTRQDWARKNHHPTVKPTDLMRYLCRLVTPPGGIVLDPFAGSGSTGKAAAMEGFRFVGIERDAEYHAIATARINAVQPQLELEAA